MKYDYLKNMKEDIRQWLEDNDWRIAYEDMTRDQLEDKLYDDLWIEDSVTGNGSGSYTFNSELAHEFVIGNEDLLKEAINCFGVSAEEVVERLDDYEWQDVTIRCYTLSQAIYEVLDEDWNIYKELPEDCYTCIREIGSYYIWQRGDNFKVFISNENGYEVIYESNYMSDVLQFLSEEYKEQEEKEGK